MLGCIGCQCTVLYMWSADARLHIWSFRQIMSQNPFMMCWFNADVIAHPWTDLLNWLDWPTTAGLAVGTKGSHNAMSILFASMRGDDSHVHLLMCAQGRASKYSARWGSWQWPWCRLLSSSEHSLGIHNGWFCVHECTVHSLHSPQLGLPCENCRCTCQRPKAIILQHAYMRQQWCGQQQKSTSSRYQPSCSECSVIFPRHTTLLCRPSTYDWLHGHHRFDAGELAANCQSCIEGHAL